MSYNDLLFDGYVTFVSPVKHKLSPNVVHRATCPVCGKKLVNLYWHNKNWQCAKCKSIDRRE